MSLPNVESEYCKGRLKTRNRAFQTTFLCVRKHKHRRFAISVRYKKPPHYRAVFLIYQISDLILRFKPGCSESLKTGSLPIFSFDV
ncbi:hypothetical protein CYK00_02845 [Neisseria sicca]|uniref:Uncharacterized protein n=1 Tax=Neisseria sicca TaxID=490 RepID=A0A2I1XEA2_NEISI|nr:hypothetical protein CYK00_02845 [Neisseria sicca]